MEDLLCVGGIIVVKEDVRFFLKIGATGADRQRKTGFTLIKQY